MATSREADPLEAAIAAWVPSEAVEAAHGIMDACPHSEVVVCEACAREACSAYQQAIAPLLARAVEAAMIVARSHVLLEHGLESGREAFRAVLTQAKPEGRGK